MSSHQHARRLKACTRGHRSDHVPIRRDQSDEPAELLRARSAALQRRSYDELRDLFMRRVPPPWPNEHVVECAGSSGRTYALVAAGFIEDDATERLRVTIGIQRNGLVAFFLDRDRRSASFTVLPDGTVEDQG